MADPLICVAVPLLQIAAGRLREQLAQLRRATRAVRKARNTHTYSQRAQGMDENGIRRHPPPGPPLTGTSRRPASASANVDAVTWRPAPSKVPLAHPEGWQQAGEFRDDYSHDLAAVRSLPYGDYKAKVMVHREMQKGMLLQHRKPPPKPPPVRSGCELGV